MHDEVVTSPAARNCCAIAAPPMILTSRSPAAQRACSSAAWMPSVTNLCAGVAGGDESVERQVDVEDDVGHVPAVWSYSSCRRYQRPVSLRPSGARSSHWNMPQSTSLPPRVGQVGVVDDPVLEGEGAHALSVLGRRRSAPRSGSASLDHRHIVVKAMDRYLTACLGPPFTRRCTTHNREVPGSNPRGAIRPIERNTPLGGGRFPGTEARSGHMNAAKLRRLRRRGLVRGRQPELRAPEELLTVR